VDVYAVGYSGSETSSSQASLDEIRPEFGLVSSSGPFGSDKNPDEEVIKRLFADDGEDGCADEGFLPDEDTDGAGLIDDEMEDLVEEPANDGGAEEKGARIEKSSVASPRPTGWR
jgi:hypothetical protein